MEGWLRRGAYDRIIEDVTSESEEPVQEPKPGSVPVDDIPLAKADELVAEVKKEAVDVDMGLSDPFKPPDSHSAIVPEADIKPIRTPTPAVDAAASPQASPVNHDDTQPSFRQPHFCTSISPQLQSTPKPIAPPLRPLPRAYSPDDSLANAFPSPGLEQLPLPTIMSAFPTKFIPLVEAFRSRGYQRVARTDIGQQVRDAMSAMTFKHYTREAERLGIVRLGRSDGFPQGWITLTVCLPDAPPPSPSQPPSTANPAPTFHLPEKPKPDRSVHHRAENAQLFLGSISVRARTVAALEFDLRTLLALYFLPDDVWGIMLRDSKNHKIRIGFVRLNPRCDVRHFVMRAARRPLLLDGERISVQLNCAFREEILSLLANTTKGCVPNTFVADPEFEEGEILRRRAPSP